MPTRYPSGINCGLSNDNPLFGILSSPEQAGEWSVYYNDFHSNAGLAAAAGSTGVCLIITDNTESEGECGVLQCSTAATGNKIAFGS